MRAIIQLVKEAFVKIDGKKTADINRGMVVFLGIEQDDNLDHLKYMVNKIVDLRVFEDSNKKMNLNVKQTNGTVLVVSQFTICGDVRRGNRPSFTDAADKEKANLYYNMFVELLAKKDIPVVTGVFQAHMEVGLVNDGPVTIMIDSRKQF